MKEDKPRQGTEKISSILSLSSFILMKEDKPRQGTEKIYLLTTLHLFYFDERR